MELWVPGKEVITQGRGTADIASLPWVCSGNARCEPQEDLPRWPPGQEQWSHRWWTAPLETNQCIIWQQQRMWTWISDIYGELWKHNTFLTVKWTNEEKELALLTSLSEKLPELHFAPDLAAAAEKPTSSCFCSRGEFSFPHYLCLTDCSSLYIPPPILPHHPPFLNWRAALWFPNSFVSYFIDHLTHWSECLHGKLHLQLCCTPFKKRMTLPHLPASKGCSFSRPMKVML